MKKLFLVIGFLAVFGFAFNFSPAVVKAQTAEELQVQIAELLSKITQLQQRLVQIQDKPTDWCYDFDRNIKWKDKGKDVGGLHTALEKEGFEISQGERTSGYFYVSTLEAAMDFQRKYKDDISRYAGYEIDVTGFVGKGTRAKLNELYGCGVVATTTVPSITVLSPNGGERWEFGKTYNIKWTHNLAGNLSASIFLHKGTEFYGKIASGISNAQNLTSYEWRVGDIAGSVREGSDYQIAVQYFDNGRPTAYDLSESYFSIVAATTTTVIPTLNVSLDPSTPTGATLNAGQSSVTFAKIKLMANENPVNTMNKIQVGSDSVNAASFLTNFRIYDGTTLLASSGDLIFNGSYYYLWLPVSGFSVPAYDSKVLSVVADVKSTAPSGFVRLGIAGWNFNLPGAFVVPPATPIYGNNFSIVSATGEILYKTEWNAESLITTLLRSDDGGKTWNKIMTQYKGGITYATDSKNPKIIYAGDTDGNQMSGYLDIDLIKSANGGDTMINISRGVISERCSGGVCTQYVEGTDKEILGINSIWVDPSDSNIVKVTASAFSNEKITFKSTDGGMTWIKETEGDSGYTFISKTDLVEDLGDKWKLYDHDTSGGGPYYSDGEVVYKVTKSGIESVKFTMGGSDWRNIDVKLSRDGTNWTTVKNICCSGSRERSFAAPSYFPFYVKFFFQTGSCCGTGSYITVGKTLKLESTASDVNNITVATTLDTPSGNQGTPKANQHILYFTVKNNASSSVYFNSAVFNVAWTPPATASAPRVFNLYDANDLTAKLATFTVASSSVFNNAELSFVIGERTEGSRIAPGTAKTYYIIGDTRDAVVTSGSTNGSRIQLFIVGGSRFAWGDGESTITDPATMPAGLYGGIINY